MEDRTCPGCGEVIVPHERERNRKVWCSIACRSRHKRRTDPDYVERERERVRNTPRSKAMPTRMVEARVRARRAARGSTGFGFLVMGHCKTCLRPFTALSSNGSARYCSTGCGARPASDRSKERHRRRALELDAFVSHVERMDIYERDRWMCQVCGAKVNGRLSYPHPRSPSLDHVIPLASGGTHEPANCQLAHLICNSTKGAGCAGEQLRLIG